MKKVILQCALVLMIGIAGLSLCSSSASATFQSPQHIEQPAPAPVPVRDQAYSADFSDADFETADQSAVGAKTGGDTVIIGSTVAVVVVCVVLLLILI